jgi:hypothetical protein
MDTVGVFSMISLVGLTRRPIATVIKYNLYWIGVIFAFVVSRHREIKGRGSLFGRLAVRGQA